jgi:hypothetical protein
MIPSTKISQTILKFGKAAILELPKNHTKEEFEATMKMVVLAWNVVVMDQQEKGNKFELEFMLLMETAPAKVKLIVKRLLKRKKTKFASDPRGVGNYWVREENGGLVFGCEARLNVEDVDCTSSIH